VRAGARQKEGEDGRTGKKQRRRGKKRGGTRSGQAHARGSQALAASDEAGGAAGGTCLAWELTDRTHGHDY
jgi:hypothetical protein